jgi:hypothetical protein
MNLITLVINALFVTGVAPVLFYKLGMIPVSEMLVTAYWFIAIASPCIVTLTLIRWVKKFPAPLTWLQASYGVTAMYTWMYSSIVLLRHYSEEGLATNLSAAILSVPTIPLSLLAVYLTVQAIKRRFRN